MAPEQTLASANDIGTWRDVYLLGGILYQLLTSRPPHERRDASEAFIKATKGVVQPPQDRQPDREIPSELGELAMRALAREPNDRVSSATEFVRQLQDYLSGAGKRRESQEITVAARKQLAS